MIGNMIAGIDNLSAPPKNIKLAYGDYICLPTENFGKEKGLYKISTGLREYPNLSYGNLEECSSDIKVLFY